jgi:glycosyltransferase involved in cell wall biosynthesis
MVSFFYGRNHLYYGARNTRYAVNVLAYRIMLRRWRFSRALCFSEHVAHRLIAFGCKAAKVAVVPLGMAEKTDKVAENGAEMSPFRANEYPRILTIAGIAHHKGLHDALRAVAGLVTSYPTLHYVVIGGVRDRGYAAYLVKVVRRLHLTRHVSFVSHANDARKNAALEEADLYVQPSHEEGFCLAFLEAAANTGRLVGTDTGEIPAMAGNDPLARIVPPMNPRALQQGILSVLGVPESLESLTARRRRLKKKYSWSILAARLTSLYEDLLRNPRVPVEEVIEKETMKNNVHAGTMRPHIDSKIVGPR